jgi:hypothetical protein
MQYLIGYTENEVQNISAILYQISRPPEVVNFNDATIYLLSFFKHPTLNEWALAIDNYSIYINPLANFSSLLILFASDLAADEITTFTTLIQANIGNNINLFDITPVATKAKFLNYDNLNTAGWFNYPDTN